MIKFTVLIATNRKFENLSKTLDALRAQQGIRFDEFELLIVENSGEARLKSFMPEIAGTMPFRVRYLHEPRRGKPYALNTGIASSKAWVVVFLDDDMVPVRNYLARTKREFDKHRDADAVTGRVLLPEGHRWPIATHDDPSHRLFRFPVNPWQVGSGNSLSVKKEVFHEIGYFDAEFGTNGVASGEDIEFVYRLLRAGRKIHYAPDIVSYHHHGRDTEDGFIRTFRHYGEGASLFFLKYVSKKDVYAAKLLYWTFQSTLKRVLGFEGRGLAKDDRRVLRRKSWSFFAGMIAGLLKYPVHRFRAAFESCFPQKRSSVYAAG